MDTAAATFQADKAAAFTPKLGKVKPIDIISLERRPIDEKTVTDLVEDLARDHRFLHPIAVRDEGATGYRLIAGHQRLEAWRHHFGERQPIQAFIFPSDMPDARITLLVTGEDLHRKDLTPPERQARLLRYAAARKELEGEKLATELPVSGSDARSASKGGRGKIAATAKLAGELGLTKPAVQKQIKAASDAIGEPIDLDHDTPEELERKAAELEEADKRQRAEPKAERPKRRKPALCAVTEDVTPAESQAGEIDSEIEEVWRAFSALNARKQLKIMLRACRFRGWALRMGRARRVPAVDEESAVGLLPEAAPPTDAAAAGSQAEQQDDDIDVGTEDLQDAHHASEDVCDASDDAAEVASGDHASDHDLSVAADEHACDNTDNVSEAADQEPHGATKCAFCNIPFESGDQLEVFNEWVHHAFCVEDAKKFAKAKQGKQIAIAA